MTPLELAKSECANYNTNGWCENMDIEKGGKIIKHEPLASCLIKTKQRCGYFERMVLPIFDILLLYPDNNEHRIREIKQAKELYERRHRDNIPLPCPEPSSVPCPDCGADKPKGRMRCLECGAKRKRESAKRRKAKEREKNRV